MRGSSRPRSVADAASLLLALGVALAPGVGGSSPAAPARPDATPTVLMDGTSFQPATLAVRVGDRVAWRNADPFPHTATSTTFDSGVIPAGGSWSFTAPARGTFGYVCTLHPTMKATLRVQ